MDAHLSKDELSGRLPVVSPHLRIILGGRMDHGVMDDPFVAIPEFKDAQNRIAAPETDGPTCSALRSGASWRFEHALKEIELRSARGSGSASGAEA
jgi:hypothetical protein